MVRAAFVKALHDVALVGALVMLGGALAVAAWLPSGTTAEQRPQTNTANPRGAPTEPNSTEEVA